MACSARLVVCACLVTCSVRLVVWASLMACSAHLVVCACLVACSVRLVVWACLVACSECLVVCACLVACSARLVVCACLVACSARLVVCACLVACSARLVVGACPVACSVPLVVCACLVAAPCTSGCVRLLGAGARTAGSSPGCWSFCSLHRLSPEPSVTYWVFIVPGYVTQPRPPSPQQVHERREGREEGPLMKESPSTPWGISEEWGRRGAQGGEGREATGGESPWNP
ncbi:hypothetical protein NDU88_000746 [Pleurodeles waltl]|uniref:Uncharacterized protein n=1 Tax=Pleurodeles waltl TaxID=8319 RepID=A0AAV7RAX8_PLEWA|nr:hypothetical protein NDU88_000746 [Pleurodeles waltl]